MELGFYKDKNFTSTGLGVSLSIGIMNLKSTPKQNGSLENLINFSTNVDLLKLFKNDNPTHMRLKAILPDSNESYTCHPKIEIAP